MSNGKSSLFIDFAEKDVMKIKLGGEIDHHNAVGIRSSIDDLILERRPKRLVLILSNIEFMDSSGLGLIMGRYATMQNIGGELILFEPSSRVMKILQLSGLDKRLSIVKKEVKINEIVR